MLSCLSKHIKDVQDGTKTLDDALQNDNLSDLNTTLEGCVHQCKVIAPLNFGKISSIVSILRSFIQLVLVASPYIY